VVSRPRGISQNELLVSGVQLPRGCLLPEVLAAEQHHPQTLTADKRLISLLDQFTRPVCSMGLLDGLSYMGNLVLEVSSGTQLSL
jgi:hypothetical protein